MYGCVSFPRSLFPESIKEHAVQLPHTQLSTTQGEKGPAFSTIICASSHPGSEFQKMQCVLLSCVLVLNWPADQCPGTEF